MKDVISPTTKAEIDEQGNEKPIKFILEDKDYLLITAINDLSNEIKKLRMRLRR
jgi:hypothetical protein